MHGVDSSRIGTPLDCREANLRRTAHPAGVTVAFDANPAGRQAAVRAHPLLRPVSAWPTSAALPAGQDLASLAQHSSPGALRAALHAATPLAAVVVDERLDP